MQVKEFLNILNDASVKVQLVGAKNQIILANGSMLKKGELRKYDDWQIKSLRIDEWFEEGHKEKEIELSIIN